MHLRRRSSLLPRRRSNLFKSATQDLGSGRTIPIKQGYLLKKSNNSNSKITNKKWKKKYVTIGEGKLEYFDHINQYMDNPNSGKSVELKHVTVKLTRNHAHNVRTITDSLSTLSLKKQSFNVPPEEAYGFQLISVAKQWDFEMPSKTERDEWVELIEEQIVKCLQANVTDRVSSRREDGVSEEDVAAVKSSNPVCADCGVVISKGGGYWASLNLCVVVCIGCSGVHRNLGVHISKVRSFELDEMSNLVVSPLRAIESNAQANRIYEATVPPNTKINGSTCSSEERMTYIKRKYENLEFLPNEPNVTPDAFRQCIMNKDFWRFLLNVNLIRKHGLSNLFWSDAGFLELATKIEFNAAAQIIAWNTNTEFGGSSCTPQKTQTPSFAVNQYYSCEYSRASTTTLGGVPRVLNNNNNASNTQPGGSKKLVI